MNAERFLQLTIRPSTMPLIVNTETETAHAEFGNNRIADGLNIPNSSSSCLFGAPTRFVSSNAASLSI